MKEKLMKYGVAISAGFTALAGNCLAAADADLTTAISSTTDVLVDNKTQIVGFIAAIVVATLLIGLAKGALLWGKRAIMTIFGGRRRRK